jgi:peptidoglycan/LPS O-acetylase OafA/YrhL
MPRRALRKIIPVLVLVILCSAVATILSTIVVSTANIRGDDTQQYVFAAIFLIALVAGLVWLPLGKRT